MANYHTQQAALEVLIQSRQIFEEENLRPPFNRFKTTMDFLDVEGNGLLHYAAANGDLAKVQEYIAKGADINLASKAKESAFEIALKRGQLKVAEYLYIQGADCNKVHPGMIKDENCRTWFNKQIKLALHQSYPVPAQDISCPFQKTKFFSARSSLADVLGRAVAVGDLNFMKLVVQGKCIGEFKYVLEGLDESPSLLVTAAKYGQMEMVKFLLENGASINPKTPYADSALKYAVINNDKTMIDYLLDHGADINVQDNFKNTPLIYATWNKQLEIVNGLIAKGAEVTIENINGENVLHNATRFCASDIIDRLLALPQKKLLNKQNIYGKKPFQIAFQVLDSKSQPQINQIKILHKMAYFLRSQYRNCQFLIEEGLCNGFAFLKSFYAARGMEQYFFDTLALFSSWDGTEATLHKPLVDEPHAELYKTFKYRHLGDLFEQWINDLIWFQQYNLQAVIPIAQHERHSQYELVQDQRNNVVAVDFKPCAIFMEIEKTRTSIKQMQEIFYYLKRMPPNVHFEVGGGRHSTSGYKNHDNEFVYYDCNFPFATESTSDLIKLVNRIEDYKYIGLKKKFEFNFYLYFFKKDEETLDLDNFKIFSEAELPKTVAEAKAFQAQSANGFTHLHVAMMTHSIPLIQQLITEGICDINAKDVLGKSALSLAIESNFIKGVQWLLASPHLDRSTIDKLASVAYCLQNHEILQLLINDSHSNNLQELLFKAIERQDLVLVEQLLRLNKIDIHAKYHDKSLMQHAVELKYAGLCQLLLKNIDKPGHVYFYFLVDYIERDDLSFNFLVKHAGKDLLQCRSNEGLTLLHYAILNNQKEKIKMLLDAGCDVNLVTPKKGNSSLMVLIQLTDFPAKYELIETLMKYHPSPNIKNSSGETAMDLINASNDDKMKEIFIKYGWIKPQQQPRLVQ